MQKLSEIMAIAGLVAVGIPAILQGARGLLKAILLVCKAIPGEQPDKAVEKAEAAVEKVEALAQKALDIIGKIFPLPKKQ